MAISERSDFVLSTDGFPCLRRCQVVFLNKYFFSSPHRADLELVDDGRGSGLEVNYHQRSWKNDERSIDFGDSERWAEFGFSGRGAMSSSADKERRCENVVDIEARIAFRIPAALLVRWRRPKRERHRTGNSIVSLR